MANKPYGTLYIGSSSQLKQGVKKHKKEYVSGFTKKYHLHMLVYYECGVDKKSMLRRESQLKKWNRQWKVELIEKMNPTWRDLYEELS